MFDIFAAKKAQTMIPLWSLVPTVLVSTLVSHYIVRAIAAAERGAVSAFRALRQAARRNRQEFIPVKPVDNGCGKASKCGKSEG